MTIKPVEFIPESAGYAERHNIHDILEEFINTGSKYGKFDVSPWEYVNADHARVVCDRHAKQWSMPLKFIKRNGEIYVINESEMKKMREKVVGETCICCVHRPVCKYQDDYNDIRKAISEASVSKRTEDGKYSMKKVVDYEVLNEIKLTCIHYMPLASQCMNDSWSSISTESYSNSPTTTDILW